MTFTERIVLKPNHTYRQLIDDKKIAEGDWTYAVRTNSVRLIGAITLEEGKSMEPHFSGYKIGCDNELIKLDGTEVILCAKRKSDGIVLQHLAIGDPDSPVFITFVRAFAD